MTTLECRITEIQKLSEPERMTESVLLYISVLAERWNGRPAKVVSPRKQAHRCPICGRRTKFKTACNQRRCWRKWLDQIAEDEKAAGRASQ